MSIALLVVTLIATVIVSSSFADRVGFPAPLVLILVGAAASFTPSLPQVALPPELVLIGFLPPLLYAAAVNTSILDIRNNKETIGFLAVSLVLITALAVGLVVHWLLDVPLAVGVALGAVVAPPDAVAATAIGRRVGLPRRVVTILEGESLINDATALVSLRSAVAAMSATVSVWAVLGDFVWAVVGATIIGLALGKLTTLVRTRWDDPMLDTSASFVIPFLAYIPAEEVHTSGVLAVVVTGLFLGKTSQRMQTASQRLLERVTWSSLRFLLEHVVFLLIGLQAKGILSAVSASELGVGRIAVVSFVVLALVMAIRPLVVFTARVIPFVRRSWGDLPWQESAVVSWAGMRGVVTLAAAFGLPENTPHREALVVVALVVTVGTLLLQGMTLPSLARALEVRGPDPREDALQLAALMHQSARVGLDRLKDVLSEEDRNAYELLEQQTMAKANSAWEELGRHDELGETPTDTYRRLRLYMLSSMRREVLEMAENGKVDHEVVQRALTQMDTEEATLERTGERSDAIRSAPALQWPHSADECEHLLSAADHVRPQSLDCVECERAGEQPVHLRMCMTCGHVACCDSSVGRHAEAHYFSTAHPVMRSFEPGEHWRWCYVDEQVG